MAGKVGFIGLGNMGGHMAMNLVKHDFALVVYDTDATKVTPLQAHGVLNVRSPADVARVAERTISMVATTAQAEAVISGEHGIRQGAGKGHIVISMSTIDPFAAQRLHSQLATQGIAMLDAPVSGGTVRAESGELSIMVGGDRAVFDACQDLFRAMGKNIFYIGSSGQGLAMKLVNNMLVQVNLVAVCEALIMGVKAGLEAQTIYDVVRVSTGNSHGFESRVPKILARDFAPGGTIDISYKDQELETAFAKQLGVPVFLANVSQQVYQMARAAGLNNQDSGAIIQVLEQLAGVRVGTR
jgi:3-hydroxyisobutyrate dehydrogenase